MPKKKRNSVKPAGGEPKAGSRAMVTIKQIAKMAGVSPSTVANVLHGRNHKMKGETLQRVRRIISETNYTPHMGGRLLGNSGSRIIGVIISIEKRDTVNVVQSPFFSEIIGGLEYFIRKNGYFMMLYSADNVEESVRMAGAWNIEGLIVMGCNMEECSRFVNSTRIPLVFIDSYFLDDGLPYHCIGLEDRLGGYLMAGHLFDKGHRNISFISSGSLNQGVFYERYCGCKQAAEERQIPFGKDDCLILPLVPRHVQDFLQSFTAGRMKKYTALFFAYDFLALHIASVLMENGIRIPQDVSVCGFDGDIYSAIFHPQLTTMRQNVTEKADNAVSMLLRLIKKEKPEQRIIRLDVSLCEGKSVGEICS